MQAAATTYCSLLHFRINTFARTAIFSHYFLLFRFSRIECYQPSIFAISYTCTVLYFRIFFFVHSPCAGYFHFPFAVLPFSLPLFRSTRRKSDRGCPFWLINYSVDADSSPLFGSLPAIFRVDRPWRFYNLTNNFNINIQQIYTITFHSMLFIYFWMQVCVFLCSFPFSVVLCLF